MDWERRYTELIKNGYSGQMTLELSDNDKSFLNQIKEVLPKFENIIFSDFGCGIGKYLNFFSEFFKATKIIGYDIVGKAIDYCKVKYPSWDFYFCDGEMQKTDIIWSSFTIQHLNDEKAIELLKVFKKALNKNGSIFIVNTITKLQNTPDTFFRNEQEHIELANIVGLNCKLLKVIKLYNVDIGVFELKKKVIQK